MKYVRRYILNRFFVSIAGFLFIFITGLTLTCNRQQNTIKEDNKKMYLNMLWQYLKPDDVCVNTLPSYYRKLDSSTSIQLKEPGYFYLKPQKLPVKIKITFLQDSCILFRNYSYCNNLNRFASSDAPYNDQFPINCKDGQNSKTKEIVGNIGTSDECDLNFSKNINFIYAYAHTSDDKPCLFEIQYIP